MIPILQIRKVKHRKAKKFDKVTQLASKWHRRIWVQPVWPGVGTGACPTSTHCFSVGGL